MKTASFLLLFLFAGFFTYSQTLLYEDFEGRAFPPPGWTLINGNAPAGYNWARNTDSTLGYVSSTQNPYPAFQGSGSMVYETDVANAKAWILTPALSLENSASYTITFYYRVAKADNPEKMRMTVGEAATIEAQTNILWDNNGDTSLTNETFWTQGKIIFTPKSSGNFYFGFNCYSNANRAALVVDNIKVETAPAAVPPCPALKGPVSGAVNITAPQALFTWDSASAASQYLLKLGTTSNPETVAFSTGLGTYRSNLDYNTTYYWTVVATNAAGNAIGCPVDSFTTQQAPPPPTNDNCAGAIALYPGSTIHGDTRSASQSMAAENCNGSVGDANDDVWFKFTPSQPGDFTLTLTPDLIFDGVINTYSGSCGSLQSMQCADNGVDGESETLTLHNVDVGNVYYFRIYAYDTLGREGSFTLTTSGTILPVNITGFKGVTNNAQNDLTWTTQTEQNNKGFELQRSPNGKDFTELALVESKAVNGNSSSATNYHFTDLKPLPKNYYRLKQVDKDGKAIISNVVLLNGPQTKAFALSNIYPNPARSTINFLMSSTIIGEASILITDLAGKPIMKQLTKLKLGSNYMSLDINNLPAGTYFINAISTNGQITVNKLVKQ